MEFGLIDISARLPENGMQSAGCEILVDGNGQCLSFPGRKNSAYFGVTSSCAYHFKAKVR
jgi:hypothetical protein